MLEEFKKLQRITRKIIASLPEVDKAIDDLKDRLKNEKYALCGGIAIVFHGYIRNTQDIDILIKSESELDRIKEILGDNFKEIRKHAIEHKETGVEVELLTPEFIKDKDARKYLDDVIEKDGFKFINLIDLISMKLKSGRKKDEVDVEYILRGKDIKEIRNKLDKKLIDKFDKIIEEADKELKD